MFIEVVDNGESLWTISQKYGVSVDDIVRVNGLDPSSSLVIGEALVIPAKKTHTVQSGETLWSIARMYHISPQALNAANPNVNPNSLQPGTVIQLSGVEKRSIDTNGYLLPTGTDKDKKLIEARSDDLSYMSFFSYHVTKDGGLVAPSDGTALNVIKNSSITPVLVITNFGQGTFLADLAHSILANRAVQNKLMDEVLKVMKNKGFGVLNIDFEHLYPKDRDAYTAFVSRMADKMHANQYKISTALAPKASAAQSGQWYEAHDYGAHGKLVDFVVLMTYEWGWSGGPPMAVAPIPQVRRILDYAVTVIPRSKIMMGAPLYGYDWTLPYKPGGKFAKSVSTQDAIELARKHGVNIAYDHTSQAPHFQYRDDQNKEHVVWFEDARSAQAKFNLIREYDLRGISYWVLGNPFSQNWALLKDQFKINKYK